MESEPAGCGHYKVEIKNGDLRDVPFDEGMFDAVKPGGRLAITNIRQSAGYAKVLTSLGLADVKRAGPNFLKSPDFVAVAYATAQRFIKAGLMAACGRDCALNRPRRPQIVREQLLN